MILVESKYEVFEMYKKYILMSCPDYYGIKYEINPWMRVINQPNKALALAQWRELKTALKKEGFGVEKINQINGFPDMVFTANAGLIHKDMIVLSRFRYQERKGEIPAFKEWFLDRGYMVKELPQNVYFEGEGDALFAKGKLVCGYSIRSSEKGVALAAEYLGLEPIILKLVDSRFYHLDTCFCAVGDLILYYPAAFDKTSKKKIEALGETIPVPKKDAENFVCNGVPISAGAETKLITTPMSKSLKALLEKNDVDIVEVEMSEFIKAGGAAKCLTLFI